MIGKTGRGTKIWREGVKEGGRKGAWTSPEEGSPTVEQSKDSHRGMQNGIGKLELGFGIKIITMRKILEA